MLEIGARVELFSFVMWTSYLIFCVPEIGERKIVTMGREISGASWPSLRLYRWLSRFECLNG